MDNLLRIETRYVFGNDSKTAGEVRATLNEEFTKRGYTGVKNAITIDNPVTGKPHEIFSWSTHYDVTEHEGLCVVLQVTLAATPVGE